MNGVSRRAGLTEDEWRAKYAGDCIWCSRVVVFLSRIECWVHFDGTMIYDHDAARTIMIEEEPWL